MEEILKEILQEIKKIQVRIEHGIEPKIHALFEDRDIIYDKLDSIDKKIDTLTNRTDMQDMQISMIKGGKAKF